MIGKGAMTTPPLDYGRSQPRARRWAWALLGAGLLVGLGVASVAVPVRQVESRMDAVTGSMTWQTTWPLGLTAGRRTVVSPLETELNRRGIAWTADWRLLHNTHRNVFGMATCYECGMAPEILHVQSVLGGYVAGATDDELREFVRVMQSGTTAEQRAVIDAAADKALR